MSDQVIINTIAEALAGKLHVKLALQDSVAILAALRSARYAIVELPEPDVGAVDNGHVPRHWEWDVTPGSGDFAGTEVHAYSDGVIDVVYESDELTAAQARRLAAALLAAAAAAEADQ